MIISIVEKPKVMLVHYMLEDIENLDLVSTNKMIGGVLADLHLIDTYRAILP